MICTYNRPDLLEKTIRSLQSQTISLSKFEILVVHTGEVPETTEVLEKLQEEISNLRVLTESGGKSSGLAHARNLGFQAAEASIVHYLDDDVTASPNLLSNMCDTFDDVSPTPICVGGQVLPDPDGPYPKYYPETNPGLAICNLSIGPQYIDFPNESVIGANIAFTKSFLQQMGGFPEDLGRQRGGLLSNEETRLLYEANERVGVYYQPNASVSHFIPEDRLRWRYVIRRFYWEGISEWRMDGIMEDDGLWTVLPRLVYHCFAAVFNVLRVVFGLGEMNRITYALYVVAHASYVLYGAKDIVKNPSSIH